MKLIKSLTSLVAAAVLLASVSFATAGQSCCVKAKAKGKDCNHPCCVEAVKAAEPCKKCQAKASCCDQAIAKKKDCAHACCKEAAAKKEVCTKCNPEKDALSFGSNRR